MWIGLKCKNTTDGLEGRPFICTENRGTRKIPQVIKQNIVTWKNWQQLQHVHMQHQSTFLAAGDNRVSTFPAKKKDNTNATGGFMSSLSRGPANPAAYILKYFYPQATPKWSCSVVLGVGLRYFNVPVKSKLNHPPWAFQLLAGYWVFKTPPSQGLKAIQISHSMSVSGDQIPTPKILIKWP